MKILSVLWKQLVADYTGWRLAICDHDFLLRIEVNRYEYVKGMGRRELVNGMWNELRVGKCKGKVR